MRGDLILVGPNINSHFGHKWWFHKIQSTKKHGDFCIQARQQKAVSTARCLDGCPLPDSNWLSLRRVKIYLVEALELVSLRGFLPKIMRWTVGRPRKTKLGIHDDGRFRGLIGREFYVHSGGFKSVGRLCIGGDCFEMMWSSNGDDLQSPLEVTRVPH